MKRNETRMQQANIAISCIRYITILLLLNLIGELGILYFAATIECYYLLSLLLSDCLPDYMARFIRSRMGKGQYKNAEKVMKISLLYGIFTGIIGTLILLIFSDFIAGGLLHIPEASLALKIIAPAFLLQAVCAALKGVFQGLGSHISSVIAGLLTEVFGLCFIMFFGEILFTYGQKAAALLQNHKFASMYGAAGAVIGIPLSLLFALAFLLLMYFGAARKLLKKKKDGMRLTEDGIDVLRMLFVAVVPVAATKCLLRLPILSGMAAYAGQNHENLDLLADYGTLYGTVFVMIGVCIAIIMVLFTGSEYTVIHNLKREEFKTAKSYLAGGLQAVFMLGSFLTMIMLICAKGLLQLFAFPFATDAVILSLQIASPLILFIPLGVYLCHILIGIGRKYTALAGASVSYLVSLLVLLVGGRAQTGNILIILFSLWAFAIVFCLWNGGFLLWMMHFELPWLSAAGLPVLCAGITGLVLYVFDKTLGKTIGAIPFAVLSILIGGILYTILLFVLRCIREKELYALPGGKVLKKIGKILHLL